jgi:hypothetical protein
VWIHPRIVISIASGGTPKVRAKPFLASLIVSGCTPALGLTGAGARASYRFFEFFTAESEYAPRLRA